MILSQVGGLSLTWSGETTDCHKFPMKEVFEKQLDEKGYFFSSSSPSIILNLFTWKELHSMIYLF